MEIKITGTPEEIKELFRTDKDSREQSKEFIIPLKNKKRSIDLLRTLSKQL